MIQRLLFFPAIGFLSLLASACGSGGGTAPPLAATAATPTLPTSPAPTGPPACELVPSGTFGPSGTVAVHAVPVVTGLEVPWDLAFLPGGDWLVTERPGRLRLIRGTQLVSSPVLTLDTVSSGEGGMLGIALDPAFVHNSLFYIYYSAPANGTYVNRVERSILSPDHLSARSNGIVIDQIAWASVHDGGRIRFGPDGMLYISTGNATNNDASGDPTSLNGKILRLRADGTIPADNPAPTQPWFIKGLRNSEGFDWVSSNLLAVSDNGPTGEYLGRTGGDKLNLASIGDDLGWPTIWHCETAPGLTSSILSWVDAVPPGGLLYYRGADIPAWTGSILIGSTGAKHIHRVVLAPDGSVALHEVYLENVLGRIRSVVQGPSGEIFLTTTNCDGRGTCPPTMDGIYRIQGG